MLFTQIRSSGDRNFSYLIGDEASREAALVDPGEGVAEIIHDLESDGWTLTYIINTHDHFDHTGGNAEAARLSGAKIAMHERACSYHDISLVDGDVVRLGSLELTILHTPGHTHDSICILAQNELMTGDTLFVGKIGGTRMGSDERTEYDSIHHKLMSLPDDVRVWPGHDYGVRPSSTIGDERRGNPFIQCPSFEAFIDLKRNWAEYKRTHNIQ